MVDTDDSKVCSPSVSSWDKKKNKRVVHPSPKNLSNLPPSSPDVPRCKQSSDKSQNPKGGLLPSKATPSQSKEEAVGGENETADWDDPIVLTLEELLSSGLHALLRDVIKRLVECGYSEDVAMKSISRCGLYYEGKDLVSNVVNDALIFLTKRKSFNTLWDVVFEDLEQMVKFTMLEMINVLMQVKPSLSIAEAMWLLLLCDLNISQACTLEGDTLNFLNAKEVSERSSSSSTPSQSISEAQNSLTISPNTSEPNTPKSTTSNSQSYQPESLKFGTFANLPKPKIPTAQEELLPTRESLVSVAESVEKSLSSLGEHVQNMSLTPVSEERSRIDRKGK